MLKFQAVSKKVAKKNLRGLLFLTRPVYNELDLSGM